MTIVKIGNTYINFDLVTSVRELAPGGAASAVLRLEFGPGHSIELVDGHAQAKAWLDLNSTSPPVATP